MFDSANNREYARLNSLLLVRVMTDESTGVEALTDNIGFGGVRLRLPINIPAGQAVKLLITHGEHSFTVRARCVWSAKSESQAGEYSAGFSYLDEDIATFEKLRDILNLLSDNDRMEI